MYFVITQMNTLKKLLFLLFLFFLSCDVFYKKIEVQTTISKKTLDAKEKSIDISKTIFLTTLDWPPYIGQDVPKFGYIYQIVKEIYESLGYNVIIKFYPWARTMRLASQGEIDGYFPEYFNEALTKDFYFSEPMPGGPVGFYGRKDINYMFQPEVNMKDFYKLKSYRIGIVRGYTNTKYFDAANYLLKEETIDDLSNLKKLYYDRVHLIFIDPNVAKYLIEKYLLEKYPDFFDKTYFLEPALEYKDLYLCISKDTPYAKQKIEDFNKVLKVWKENGKIKQLLNEFDFNERGIWKPKN